MTFTFLHATSHLAVTSLTNSPPECATRVSLCGPVAQNPYHAFRASPRNDFSNFYICFSSKLFLFLFSPKLTLLIKTRDWLLKILFVCQKLWFDHVLESCPAMVVETCVVSKSCCFSSCSYSIIVVPICHQKGVSIITPKMQKIATKLENLLFVGPQQVWTSH